MDIKELRNKRVEIAAEIQTIYNKYHSTLDEGEQVKLEHEFKDKHIELKKINRRIVLLKEAFPGS